jgi:hypothetical protein
MVSLQEFYKHLGDTAGDNLREVFDNTYRDTDNQLKEFEYEGNKKFPPNFPPRALS